MSVSYSLEVRSRSNFWLRTYSNREMVAFCVCPHAILFTPTCQCSLKVCVESGFQENLTHNKERKMFLGKNDSWEHSRWEDAWSFPLQAECPRLLDGCSAYVRPAADLGHEKLQSTLICLRNTGVEEQCFSTLVTNRNWPGLLKRNYWCLGPTPRGSLWGVA